MTAPVTPWERGRRRVAQVCMGVVVAMSLAGIVVTSPVLGIVAGLALAVYLALSWRQFTVATWITVGLCIALLILALLRGIDAESLSRGLERMAYLATLLALLGSLRVVASDAPEVGRAGRYLTTRRPGRRYLAMNFGGHVFGVLINLGGIAILLDMTRRTLEETSAHLPAGLREWRLRRMTTAVLRGFSLAPLWSPIGLGLNGLLLAMPSLHYGDVAPAGLLAATLFLGWGWFLDWAGAPAIPAGLRPGPGAGPGAGSSDWGGVVLLTVHVGLVAGLVFALHAASGLPFQQALLIAVPAYSVAWAAWLGHRGPEGALAMARRTVVGTVGRFPLAAAEIGVFASAGLLSVLVLELLPLSQVQTAVATLIHAPWQMIALLNLSMFLLAAVGINPIITASVMGSLVTQLDVRGLSDAAAALSLAGTWGCVMGFTPLITTVVYAGTLVGRPPWVVGIRWNGLYSLSSLILWTIGMGIVVELGLF